MSSFWDRVDKVNQKKKKEDEEKQKKAQSGTPSSFWDRVDKVNSGEIKVNTSMNDRDVTDWSKGAYDVAQRSVNFLKTDGYKLDDKYGAEIDSYLNNADYVAQYLRANKNNIQDYDKVLSSHYDTVNYLKRLREGIDQSNKFYSRWGTDKLVQKHGSAEEAYKYGQRIDGYSKKYEGKTSTELQDLIDSMEDGEEKEWLKSYASTVDYDEKAAYDLEAAKKEIEKLEKQKEALFQKYRGILASNHSATTYLAGPNGSPQTSGNYIGKIEGEESYVIRQMKYLEDEINQKKQYLTLAERIQNGIKLSSVADPTSDLYDPDFDSYTGYVSTKSDEWHRGLTTKFGLGYDDLTYEYINGKDNGMRNKIWSSAVSWKADTDDYHAYNQMTDDEIAIYNYYYAKNGKKSAEEYLNSIIETLRTREARERFKSIEGKTGLELVFGLAAGVDQFESGIKNLFNGDDYIPASSTQILSGMVREDLADDSFPIWYNFKTGKWEDEVFGSSVGQGVYDLTTTTANMAPSILTSAVVGMINPTAGAWFGAAMMGGSAAGNAYADALNRGLDKSQAAAYGVAIGVSEALLEKALSGISKFGGTSAKITKAVSGIDDALLRWSLRFGGSFASEALEEGLQEILDPIFQNAIFGTDEDVNWSEVAYSALLGGLSAGVFEGNSIRKDINKEQSLKTEYEGKTDALIQEGLESDIDTESYKLAKDYKAKTEGGKSLTGAEIRNILAANQEQIAPKDLKKIQKAAEARLTELGQTKDVQKLAELATKYATGQKLSKADKAFLANNKNGNRVAQELIPENIMSGEYTSEWAEGIGTKQVNKLAYNIKNIIEQMAKPATYKPLTERVGKEDKAGVSESGKATVNGKEISLNKKVEVVDFVRDKKTGKITDIIINADGKQVKASEIDYADDDQAFLFSAVKHIENITPADAQVIIRDYDPSSGISVGEYLNGVDEAYTYGYHGYTEADMKSGLFTTKLSDEKSKGAYELGKLAKKSNKEAKSEDIKRMRTAVEAETEKSVADGKPAPKSKNMTITYNKGNGEVVSIDDAGIKDAKRSGAVWVAKILHKLGLGTRVEFFESFESTTKMVKDRKTGKMKPARVFINDQGVEQIAYSGVYRKSDGTIRVDLNAYNGRGLTLNALAHELTHFIQKWSSEKYEVLADFLVKTYEGTDMTMHKRVLREQKRLEDIRGEEVSYNEAFDEVVANAMSKMFDDGKLVERLTELKAQDEKLARKLWEGFKKIMSKFLGIYQESPALFDDAGDLVAMKDTFEQLQGMFAEALVEASDNYQASLTVAESQTITEAGIGFDEDTKSVYSLHFSTAYQDVIQVGKKKFDTEEIAQIVAKGTNRSIEDARKWVQSEMAIANIVMANPEFLDFEADNRYEAIKKNSDYPQGTVDLSNLCPKREEFTTMFDMLQKKYPNKLFTAQDIAEMRKILAKNDITVACGACFVEDRRQLIGEIADTFSNMWKESVESGKPLQKTNAEGKNSDLLVTKALAKQYGLTAGSKIMATDTYIPNQYDLTTYEGFKLLEKNHPTIAMAFNRYNNSRGQQAARLIEGRAEYNRQILGWSDAKVRSVNNNGGLRIFSFSDFEVVHLLDLVQVIIDCAAKGVKIQGYTKVPAFAKLVRGTGIKLNRSLIPKGDYGFHMENGKVVLDYDTTDGIDINDKNFIDESDNPDVGNIVIGINPTQIGAAMLDPFIDYIIPFHSNKAKEILRKLGTGEWVNYKESQHEKDISTGKASKHNVNIYTEVINKYHPTNKVEFVEAFLKECKRQGKIPRYAEFLNVDANGDYAYREGYHKLLVDFKMFDAEGNILPQGNITPNLDDAFMAELLNAEIDRKQNYEFPQEVYDAIDKQFGERHSSQETDFDSDGNKLTEDQAEFFEKSKVRDGKGNLKVLYHGSKSAAFTEFDISKGVWLTPVKSYAEDYAEFWDSPHDINGFEPSVYADKKFRLYKMYANIKNPADIGELNQDITDTVIAALAKALGVEYSKVMDIASNYEGYWVYEMTRSKEFIDLAADQGFDGFKASEVGMETWCAFSAQNQVKLTTNEVPSGFSDIRYSSQETDLDTKAHPYAYDTLVSKPDMRVTTVDLNVPKNRADVVYQAKQNAAKVGKFDPKTGSVSVYVDDINANVLLGTDGLKHGLRRTKDPQNDANYIVTIKAGEIIKNSIKVNEMNPKKVDAKESLVLIGVAKNPGGDTYVVRSIVNRFSNELTSIDALYAINAKKQELAATKSPRFTAEPLSETSSTISIAELLDLVNRYFPDVLPEDVLKHYEYEARPEGDLGAEMLYSEHDTDYTNRDLLANAFETLSQNSEEYKLIQQYKGRIKLLNEYEEKLSKLNSEIREIRFGKGKYDAERLAQLEAKAKEMAKLISKNDKKLLSLEASEPLRKVIEQERKKEAQKTKEHVREIQQNKKLRAEQAEYRHKIRKTVRDLDKLLNRGNKKTNVKEDMKGFVSKALELADFIFTDHVSNDDLIRKGITVRMTPREEALVRETEDILTKIYDDFATLTAEEFTDLDDKRKRNMEKLRDLLTSQRNERLKTPVYNLFNDLVAEYASLKNSKQDAVKAAYDPSVEMILRNYIGESNGETDSDRVTLLKNMRVADMTTKELENLYYAYKIVLTSVRNANKLHIQGKAESIQQVADSITRDFTQRKAPDKTVATVIRNISNKIGWDYEKLYYALDRIGSEAFTELVMNIANSENIVMQDVIEAALFRDEMVKKYGFNKWDVNKKIDREFLDTTGKKFEMTLGQLMSLYAYSRRDGAWDHIEYGGFVFGEKALTNPKPADSYKLTKDQCEAITNTLTKEQKGYVEDMQKFLSETMGEKGNEVSMLLYGIKMFGEKNYFPIHVAGEYMANAQESKAKEAAGFSSMTSAGFTKAQNPNAKAPFVLEGFNEIWADHVNEMSRYHGTVPALEDFRRVMNRSTYSDSTADSISLRALMENSYGKEAVDYFDNLYKEANSGAIRDKLEKKSQKLLSLFRKNSVAYSLSVLIQQPASIVRAYALIDKKYFGIKGFGAITSGVAKAVSDRWTKAHTNAYNEMLKYAPGVTMAKEIGGFDTATGGSIRSYLLDTDKGFFQSMKTENLKGKAGAVMDLVDDNAIANLPNLADKIAWIEIWNACKRETAAKHKDLATSSEEFMKIVGERFTEVIRATQVYDSIFAKSPMLKSKNPAVQYLVSFMNEPNAVANMAESAVRDATRGNWKGGVRKAGTVIYSIIFTNVLKSLIYAMRDDDEEETYIEKYIEAITGGLMDDFNALNYIPLVRDVWSVAQGYDVERADMAIVSDFFSALTDVIKNATKDTSDMTKDELAEFEKKSAEATWQLVGSLASFFGIPVKNVRREIKGVLDHARIASANAGMTTAQSVWDKIQDSVIEWIPFMQNDRTKGDKLYDAIINGDKSYLDRLKGTYSTDNAYQNAVRKALRENDSRIHDAALAEINGNPSERVRIARLIIADGFKQDDVVMAINSEINALKSDDSSDSGTSKKKGFYTTDNLVREFANGDTASAKTAKSDIISTIVANGKTREDAERDFMSNVASSAKEAYENNWLNESKAKKLLMEYAGKDEEEATSKVNYWTLCKLYPKYKDLFNEARVAKYNKYAKPAGISVDMYAKYISGTKDLSTRNQVVNFIHSLSLTKKQKDALYLAAGYPESKIWDVPW